MHHLGVVARGHVPAWPGLSGVGLTLGAVTCLSGGWGLLPETALLVNSSSPLTLSQHQAALRRPLRHR